MNITFDYQIFGQQSYGGISRYFSNISKNISYLKNNKVCILSPLYINNYIYENKAEINNVKGIKIPYIKKSSKIIKFINYYLSISQVKELNSDILHETYYAKKSIASGREKIVLTVYDMIHELFPSQFSRSEQISEIKRIAVERADHIICISENTRRDLIKLFKVPEEKTSVIYLGFDLNDKNNFKFKTPKEKIILFVGHRSGYKNFKNFVTAYARNKEIKNTFKIVVFGGSPFTYGEKSFFKEIGLSKNNIIKENGNDQKLIEYYKKSSLLVYPSLYEGFGFPPLEAMSLGCPVACSNTSSIAEVVSDAGIYFDPYSVESISETIKSILEDDSLRKELIKKGEKRIKNFSWEKCSLETFNLYKKLIS
ncbi:MAG: glycosyltransferase family 4 protein [Prochlorococcus marinus CUG1436]|nr:glycosyltransferase family 4 protein [Prochlorococcus marinus CUG1436]